MLKKVILLFAVLSGSASAQSVTPNIGLQLPSYNSSNWGTQLNYDLTRLDGYLSGGYTIPNLSISTLTTPTVNATVNGYQINGTAPLNHFLIGNGTYYVDTAQIPAGSLPSSYTNFQLFGTPPFIGFAATAGGSNYAGLTSPSTGVFDFGNGTAGNSSGTLNAATLTATASVTTPLLNNTVSSCSFPGSTADVQIANAFASLPSSQGTVDATCYGTTTQTLAAPIVIGPQQKLNLTQATTFVPASATSDVVQIAETGSIYGLRAALNSYASTYSGSVVDSTCVSAQDTFVNIQHIWVSGAAAGATGAAVKLNCAQTAASGITGAIVSDIVSYGLDNPLQLATSGGSFLNGNEFSNLFLVSNPSSGNCIDLQNAGLEIRGNIFSGICEAGATSISSTNTGTSPIQANVFNINAYDSTDSWAVSGSVKNNVLTGNLDGTVTDNGLNTIHNLSTNTDTSNASQTFTNGFSLSTQPALFAGNSLPSLGLSSVDLTVVGTSAVTIGNVPFLAGKPWRVVFFGIWGNTADPPTQVMPALYTEVSSVNPSIQVGALTATVSLNASNVPQIVCSGCGVNQIYFSGIVFPVGQGYMTDVSNSMALQGSFSAPTLTATTSVTTPVVNNTAAQTTVTCATSGTAVFSMPERGASYKKVIVYENACIGAASYTFPTAFTYAPQVLSQAEAATATTVSATAVTVTGVASPGSTGFLELDGY